MGACLGTEFKMAVLRKLTELEEKKEWFDTLTEKLHRDRSIEKKS